MFLQAFSESVYIMRNFCLNEKYDLIYIMFDKDDVIKINFKFFYNLI